MSEHKLGYNASGEQVLGVKGDFEFDRLGFEDGFGISTMLPEKEVVKEAAANKNYYKPIEIKEVPVVVPVVTVPVTPAPKAKAMYVPQVPAWTKAVALIGLPAGLLFAAYRKSGILGYIVLGALGGMAGLIPIGHYALTDVKEKLKEENTALKKKVL